VRVQVLGEALDRAALARGVAALEHHHQLLAGVLDPALQPEQLDLQLALLDLVLAAVHPLAVGVALAPGVDPVALGVEQLAVVVPVLVGVLVGQGVEPPLRQVEDRGRRALGDAVAHVLGHWVSVHQRGC
jgi:hypothetical protein